MTFNINNPSYSEGLKFVAAGATGYAMGNVTAGNNSLLSFVTTGVTITVSHIAMDYITSHSTAEHLASAQAVLKNIKFIAIAGAESFKKNVMPMLFSSGVAAGTLGYALGNATIKNNSLLACATTGVATAIAHMALDYAKNNSNTENMQITKEAFQCVKGATEYVVISFNRNILPIINPMYETNSITTIVVRYSLAGAIVVGMGKGLVENSTLRQIAIYGTAVAVAFHKGYASGMQIAKEYPTGITYEDLAKLSVNCVTPIANKGLNAFNDYVSPTLFSLRSYFAEGVNLIAEGANLIVDTTKNAAQSASLVCKL